MKNIYALFHLNLNFSLIEESESPTVINNCYWPLIKIIEKNKNIKVAFELTGSTLEKINSLDPEIIIRIKQLINQENLEIVASGMEQILAPLVPYEVTLENLKQGRKIYKKILNVDPNIAYINEQTFSDGIVDIYKEAGFETIVIDWDNLPIEIKVRNLPYQPIQAKSQTGTTIGCIFISSIAMLQFRRVIWGDIKEEQYFNYIEDRVSLNEGVFPIYGDDLEIFDFKPGSLNFSWAKESPKEFEKVGKILNDYTKKKYRFILPSEIDINKHAEAINLTDAKLTVRTKKQEKYNVTRWAICGRTNFNTNTKSFALFENLKKIEVLRKQEKELAGLKTKLIKLWGSDFRTHTTEEKVNYFSSKMGDAIETSKEIILSGFNENLREDEFLLINATKRDWKYETFESKIHLPMGVGFGGIQIRIKDETIVSQLEEIDYYQDGSVKNARIVLRPFVRSGESVKAKMVFSRRQLGSIFKSISSISTNSVSSGFWLTKGGSFEDVVFNQISKKPLLGSLFHGYYQDAGLSADWFSGHTIISLKDGSLITDLGKVEFYSATAQEDYPIRVPVYSRSKIGTGVIVKKFYFYKDEPRIDIRKDFAFYNLEPKFFRALNITFLPESFNLEKLYLATVNGGRNVEKFYLKDKQINQDSAVNLKVSSKGCQGATEGWVALGDDQAGVALITDYSENYLVPLVRFEEAAEGFFARISLSAAESDDTSFHFFRGKLHFKNTLLGYKDLKEVEDKSYLINNTLEFIQGKQS